MPPPPPDNDQNGDNPNTSPNQDAGPSSPQRRPSPLPSISFSISIPPPSSGTPSNSSSGIATDAPQPPGAEVPNPHNPGPGPGPGSGARSSFMWTFTIRPDTDRGSQPGPGAGPPDPPLATGDAPTTRPEETNTTANTNPSNSENTNNTQPQRTHAPGSAGPGSGVTPAPPWIFPPFFNFFLPMRSEPQPNPAKATELLRSLPTVGRRLLMRVDRIVAAQENDQDVLPDEKGWKCGICLEGLDVEAEHQKMKEDKGKEKDKEAETERASSDNVDIPMDDKEKEQREKEDKEKKSSTGVKALPCNHLFHEDCLHPWFTTKHTCPSCRLDLDPLQTLNSPSTTNSTLRPGQTGSGRRSPHPYARDRSANPANNAPNVGINPTADTPNIAGSDDRGLPAGLAGLGRLFNGIHGPGLIPSVGISGGGPPQDDHQPSITFIFEGFPSEGFGMPGLEPVLFGPPGLSARSLPPAAAPVPAPTLAASAEAASTNGGIQSQEATAQTADPAPSTPRSVFDVPTFFSSPQPMILPSPSSAADPDATSTQAGDTNTIPMVASSSEGVPTSIVPPSNTASDVNTNSMGDDRPRPERRPHITIIRTSSPGPRPSNAGGGPGLSLPPAGPPGGLGLGNLPLPPFLFPNLPPAPQLLNPSQAPPPAGNHPLGGHPTQTPSASAPTSTPAPSPFVPQSLESWTEEKEKSLGWRCDAPECLYAPPVSEDDDIDMVDFDGEEGEEGDEGDEGDKEMLRILMDPTSNSSVPDLPTVNGTSTEGDKLGEGSITGASISTRAEATACEHRWHRKCLEISEKSSGRFSRQDEDGKMWVKCERCRKDGWVQSRQASNTLQTVESVSLGKEMEMEQDDEEGEYAPSEKEVENLINC
ncbi:uncharacterized protein I303_101121 [Kwoniella dejecticola CBS 10117]|uniref:RING-type domain-containing protein n=1 Tax=Kwoniella dejecticola CBS 10117 TaxID=1296121 RepID=A0A1A6AGU8_9TREE|nr:uncharacterized protein I303_01125 [Kwoniella dejecticola CBS 10117]OBR89300.1 hypothetical protein I303_01125 [Kwoniella dejecticola CBS 10117]